MAKSKRRAKGDGTISLRSDGRWYARYTVGHDPATGKQIQKSIYGKTQDEVRRKLKEKTAEIDNGTYNDSGSNLTVKAWFEIWLKDYTGNLKPDTINVYTYHTNRHIIPYIGAVKLSKLSPHHIQTLYNRLQKEDNLSAKTIINLNGVMSAALNKAAQLGYIPVSPTAKVTLPRKEKSKINPLNEQETVSLLNVVKDTKDNVLINVAIFTGARISELVGLTWDCIDFDKGIISLYRQLKRNKDTGKYYFGTLKNDRPRKIMPAPFVMALLKKHRGQQAQARLLAGALWDKEFDNLVFTNEIGQHLRPNAINRRLLKYLEQAGVPAHRFHDLRHTFVVHSIHSGNDIKTVQENVGHATASFTLDMYAHVTDDMRKDSAEQMQALADRLSIGSA